MVKIELRLVDEGGEIVKASHGNHRFAIARILGKSDVPVVVSGISMKWFAHEFKGAEQLRAIYEKFYI